LAALLAFYAARIGAARRSLAAGDVAAVVQTLINEQTVAVRSLIGKMAGGYAEAARGNPSETDGKYAMQGRSNAAMTLFQSRFHLFGTKRTGRCNAQVIVETVLRCLNQLCD
jgi:hypothetical protein